MAYGGLKAATKVASVQSRGTAGSGFRIGMFHFFLKPDDLVKSLKCSFSVIPAKAGIQFCQVPMKLLDPVFQRGDDS